MPKSYAVPPPPHHNEGKTVAAWTMNLGIVLGALGIGIGMVLSDLSILIWIGAGVVVLSVLVGFVLSKAGLGQPRQYGAVQAPPAAGAVHHSAQPAEADAR